MRKNLDPSSSSFSPWASPSAYPVWSFNHPDFKAASEPAQAPLSLPASGSAPASLSTLTSEPTSAPISTPSPPLLFPPDLWEVPQPPQEIFIQGSPRALELLHRLPEQGLAIVGTRNPQARSVAWVEKQIQDLAGTPLIILSGLARGIDAAAHSAALRWGLPTVAILGTGLHFTYPQSNLRLRQEILEADGLIVSEFPFRMPGLGHQFLQRNRLIAGWAKATWVVEAGVKSGALNTARWARELQRACYTVPCFPGDPSLAGNQTLLDRDHALQYWGTHSLGATWLELAARGVPSVMEGSSDLKILCIQVKLWTFQKGGTQIQELLDWAIARGWSPTRFFTAFQEGVCQGRILDRFGTLIGL